MTSIQLLLALVLFAAIIAVEAKDLVSSVIAIAAAGFAIALCFLILKAPDLAVVILIVEVLALTLFIHATHRTDSPAATTFDLFSSITVLVFALLFLLVASRAVADLPTFGYPLAKNAAAHVDEGFGTAGTPNIVAATALGFRAYDTLGGITALFLVALGVMMLTERRERS